MPIGAPGKPTLVRPVRMPCFRSFLKRDQGVIPEPVEVGAKRLDAGGVELVQASRARGAIDDQLRVLEDAEVLRNRRPADRKLAGNFADGQRTVEEPLDNRTASGVAECVHLRVRVSHHLR